MLMEPLLFLLFFFSFLLSTGKINLAPCQGFKIGVSFTRSPMCECFFSPSVSAVATDKPQFDYLFVLMGGSNSQFRLVATI